MLNISTNWKNIIEKYNNNNNNNNNNNYKKEYTTFLNEVNK